MPITQHPLAGRPPDAWRRIEFWAHYDMENGTDTELHLGYFCDQIIHSYIWTLSIAEVRTIDGLFFSSERDRKKAVYWVSMDALIGLFSSVAYDNIVTWSAKRDEHGDVRTLFARSKFRTSPATKVVSPKP